VPRPDIFASRIAEPNNQLHLPDPSPRSTNN